MAQGEDLGEPPFIAATHASAETVQATPRFVSSGREDRTMKLGLSIGYSGAHLEVPVTLVQRAEELGYDSVWTPEPRDQPALHGRRVRGPRQAVEVDPAHEPGRPHLSCDRRQVPDEWVDLKSLVGPPARITRLLIEQVLPCADARWPKRQKTSDR
jgi:hypothetical protein